MNFKINSEHLENNEHFVEHLKKCIYEKDSLLVTYSKVLNEILIQRNYLLGLSTTLLIGLIIETIILVLK